MFLLDRDGSINLKGIAIVLMIFHHSLGNTNVYIADNRIYIWGFNNISYLDYSYMFNSF